MFTADFRSAQLWLAPLGCLVAGAGIEPASRRRMKPNGLPAAFLRHLENRMGIEPISAE
jgi:hypothetical protein